MKATIIGDGGWGTALAMVLERNGHEVTLWGPFADYLEQVATRGVNEKFLPGVALPASLQWTADRDQALDGSELIVMAIPSKFYVEVADRFAGKLPPSAMVVSVSKGFREDKRLSTLAEEHFGHRPVAALSGPSHAEEVARGTPSAVSIACEDIAIAEGLQQAFNGAGFRVYTTTDVIGVETGGALKNIIAIAAGACDGLGYGDNTKAALITRGLAEIGRLGAALGANPATFAGLSGMGDLIVTCGSKLSRNRGVGERLGRGETRQQILDSMEQVAEGVWNSKTAWHLAQTLGVEAPITEEVYQVVWEDKNPREAVDALLSRDPKAE